MTFWQPKLVARLCVLALQHNIEPQYAKRLIKSYRLVPPEQDVPIEQWPWPIRIYTLGRFTLVKDDQPLATTAGKGHKKPLELLHTLIALGGRQVGVENIINLLWPDAEGDAGVNLFKITLHRLRKLLGHESAIDLAEGRLTLNSQEVWVDSWALARILTDVEAKTNDPAYQTDAVRRALALYRGHFLEREGEGNPALLRHREQLRVRILHAVKGLLGSLERAGDWAELIHHSERAIELDELDEDFHAAVLRGYLAQGQPALALRAYERARRIYQGLNLQPSSRLETLRRVATGDAG
jgi:DNA-binding SARP family transcriptional activator